MHRKALGALLALMIALSCVLVPGALAASISTTVTTTRPDDTLYVRKGPHKGNTPTVGTVQNGDRVTLLEINAEWDPESWSKIEVRATGAVGYLKNKYIAYFELDNSDGEVDEYEDDGFDYSSADDNDGYKGSASSTGSSSSSASLGRVQTVYGGDVNVRRSASTSSSVIGSAYDGERLTLLGTSGTWYRVKTSDGITGYIHGNYVAEGIPAYTTASSGVNFRRGAGTGYGIISTLPYGTSITVLSRSANWSRVRAAGTTGYINNSYYSYK
jgi:uncharacterized protein YgiM (DUF1202 family)